MALFNEVRNYLFTNGPLQLPYATNPQVIFTAQTDECKRGPRIGTPIIRITSGIQTNILIYEEDWGNKYTISGTLIKHIYDSLNPHAENNMQR